MAKTQQGVLYAAHTSLCLYWHFVHASWASLSDDLQTGCDATGSVWCHYWMAEIKHLYNSHLYHLMPESWHRKQETILGNISFVSQSNVEEIYQHEIKSKIRYQVGNQPTLCPLCSVSGWLHCYQQAWVLVNTALLLSASLHMKAVRHPSSVKPNALCLKRKKKWNK